MTLREKYLKVLSDQNDWLTVSEWAVQVAEAYPEILSKADEQAAKQKQETTGLREIAARISSNIAGGVYADSIDVDTSERPRRIKAVSAEEIAQYKQDELEEDVAPLKRGEIIKLAEAEFTPQELYRVAEFESISGQLKKFFALSFEVDHAQALLNTDDKGSHHPDNLQLLLKEHNRSKSNSNWKRFSYDEQVAYIKSAVQLQSLISSRLCVDLVEEILDSLMERLKGVY